jgi:hypothetical protein
LFIRFFMWIPRTPFGRLASILAGLAIAAVLWFGLFGAPSFNAPRGTEAYFRDEEALIITMIATLAGGSWIGTRLERWRLSQPTIAGTSAWLASQSRRRPRSLPGVYLVFAGVVALVIQTLKLPDIILFGYLLVAAAGFVMLLRDVARRSAFERDFKESADRLIAEAATRGQEADAVRHSAWFADNVVDLEAARRRVGLDGHFVGLGFSFLDMPNPYFNLPAEAIVKWGFATSSQVATAYAMVGNGTAPVRWYDQRLMRDLGYMGWDRAESVARIGLFLESL